MQYERWMKGSLIDIIMLYGSRIIYEACIIVSVGMVITRIGHPSRKFTYFLYWFYSRILCQIMPI